MEILRYSAFTTDPKGGNPAGVVLDATGLDDAAMQAVAADVGYSETAFLCRAATGGSACGTSARWPRCRSAATRRSRPPPRTPSGTARARCGSTARVGPIDGGDAGRRGRADRDAAQRRRRTPSRSTPATSTALLRALRWDAADLDPALPLRVAYAGAWHPVVAAGDPGPARRPRLRRARAHRADGRHDWTTVDLVWRESATVFHARNPFPPGGVYEDPATGAAAAAFGGYLRELGLVDGPGDAAHPPGRTTWAGRASSRSSWTRSPAAGSRSPARPCRSR